MVEKNGGVAIRQAGDDAPPHGLITAEAMSEDEMVGTISRYSNVVSG
jgi:hypothetical protein